MSFYPRLYEEVENLSYIDSDTIKKYLGNSGNSAIKFDPGNDQVLSIIDKKTQKGKEVYVKTTKDQKLSFRDYISLTSNSGLKPRLREYFKSLGYDVEKNEENDNFNKKNKKNITNGKTEPKEVEEIPDKTWGDFWDYQLEKLKKEFTPKEKERSRKPRLVAGDIPKDFEISEVVANHYGDKLNAFKTWISNIPTGTKITDPLIRFFRLLDTIIAGDGSPIKITGVLNIKNLKMKTLSKEVQEQWKADMVEYIGKIEKPELANEFYKNKILAQGSFLNALFMIDAAGVGRGELLMTYLIPGATFPGGGDSFDLMIADKEQEGKLDINGKTYELKDYSNVEKDSASKDSIRLGAGGKLLRLNFWGHLEKAFDIANNITDDLGKENLDKLLDPYLKTVWNNFISTNESNKRAVGAGLNSGEISDEKIRQIKLWFYLTHELVSRHKVGSKEKEDELYTMATLKGPGVKPKNISIKSVSSDDLSKNNTLEIKSGADVERSLHQLARLKYVRNPEQFQEDLDGVAGEYFGENKAVNYFLIFRPDKINILGPDGFGFATISQAAVKIIEVEYQKTDKKYKKAYTNWKETIEKAKKAATSDEKDSYENLFKSVSYRDFLRNEILGESYYPRLFN